MIDIIRYRRSLAGVPEKEASIIQLGREIFQRHKVSSETYARVLAQFGKRDLISITEPMGHRVTTFILLQTFDLHLPYDREPLLPLPYVTLLEVATNVQSHAESTSTTS